MTGFQRRSVRNNYCSVAQRVKRTLHRTGIRNAISGLEPVFSARVYVNKLYPMHITKYTHQTFYTSTPNDIQAQKNIKFKKRTGSGKRGTETRHGHLLGFCDLKSIVDESRRNFFHDTGLSNFITCFNSISCPF